MIGYSWGAWLSFIVAARYPEIIKKLILVASGSYEEKYTKESEQTRLNRLNEKEKAEFKSFISRLNDPTAKADDAVLARLGTLASQADSYATRWQMNMKWLIAGPIYFKVSGQPRHS